MAFVAKKRVCAECGVVFLHGKKLSLHFKTQHNLLPEEYALKHIYDGITPSCISCGKKTRFVSAFVGFKRYCVDCSTVAEQEAGRLGGQTKKTWNKGKTKESDARVAELASKQNGEGNSFFGRHHTQKTIERLSFLKTLQTDDVLKRTSLRSMEFELVTSIDAYTSRQRQYLEFKCNVCKTVQQKTLQAFERGSRCYKCHPVSKSNWELDVFSFVKSLSPDAVSGDRTVIAPAEIDVYVPSKRLGIECHGLYWHSDGSPRGQTNRHVHLKKWQAASNASVRLLQFFEDEWRDKRSICESLIRHRLDHSSTRIGARKLALVELDSSKRKKFFDESHLAGDVPALKAWSLLDGETIVAALSIRVPRQARAYADAVEVARFCVAKSMNVPGGLQRLVTAASAYARMLGFKRLLTYVDRRLGNGHGYECCGFKRVGDTGVDYFYTDNFLRYNRFKFRARDGKREVEVACQAGVTRIYGCGSHIYVKHITGSC